MVCITPPEARLISLVNQYRRDNNLFPLRASAILMESAQQWADYMASEDYFSHTGPDGSSHQDRAEALGYEGGVGANILYGQPTPEAAFEAWRKSPPHNDNLLSPHYQEIGVALLVEPDWDGQGDVYATAAMELGTGTSALAQTCRGDEIPEQTRPPRPRKKPRNPNPEPEFPQRKQRRLLRRILRRLGR